MRNAYLTSLLFDLFVSSASLAYLATLRSGKVVSWVEFLFLREVKKNNENNEQGQIWVDFSVWFLNNLDKILTSCVAAVPFLNCKDPNLACAKATCSAIVSSSYRQTWIELVSKCHNYIFSLHEKAFTYWVITLILLLEFHGPSRWS